MPTLFLLLCVYDMYERSKCGGCRQLAKQQQEEQQISRGERRRGKTNERAAKRQNRCQVPCVFFFGEFSERKDVCGGRLSYGCEAVVALALLGRRLDKTLPKLKGRRPHARRVFSKLPSQASARFKGCLAFTCMPASLLGLPGSERHFHFYVYTYCFYLYTYCFLRSGNVKVGKHSDKSPRGNEAPREGGTYGETCGGEIAVQIVVCVTAVRMVDRK